MYELSADFGWEGVGLVGTTCGDLRTSWCFYVYRGFMFWSAASSLLCDESRFPLAQMRKIVGALCCTHDAVGEPVRRKKPKLSADEQVEASALASSLFGAEEPSASATEHPSIGGETAAERAAAWEDPDDASIEVDISNISRLRKLRRTEDEKVLRGSEYTERVRAVHDKRAGAASWATAGPSRVTTAGATADDLLQSTESIISSKDRVVREGFLDISRVRDANDAEPCSAVVQAVRFHRDSSLLLTASLDKTVRLFDIDGKHNEKIQSVYFDDLPVRSADFGCHNEVFAAGRRPFFYSYDLLAAKATRVRAPVAAAERLRSMESMFVDPTGDYLVFLANDGYLEFFLQKSKMWEFSVKIPAAVRTVAFDATANAVIAGADDGKVRRVDLRKRAVVNEHIDEGARRCTAIAVSPDGTKHCAGSDAGVVNVYNHSAFSKSAPSPEKAIMNLTTNIDGIEFSHDGQMFAAFSRMKKDAVKLVHSASSTVFANWPTSQTPLHYVHSLAFSPDSQYLALGNARGKVLLYNIHAYA